MAVAPALPWRATSNEVLRRRLIVPAYAAGITMVIALVLGTRGVTTVLAFGLASFALAGIVRQYVVGARARHRAEAERWPTAVRRMVRGNPRLYGGLVVHAGIVCIAVALAAFGAFTTRTQVELNRGQSATVSGYTITYLGNRTEKSPQKTSIEVLLRIHHDGSNLGTYAPAISTFPGSSDAIGTPSVKTGLLRDVYLTLVSSPTEKGRVTIGVDINAMVVWLWIGGAVIALGTGIAISPELRRRKVRPDREPASAPPAGGPTPSEEPEVVPV